MHLLLILLNRCADCGVDCVEDNDFAAGIDHVDGREPIEFAFCRSTSAYEAVLLTRLQLTRDIGTCMCVCTFP